MIEVIIIPLLLTVLGLQLRIEHRLTKIETMFTMHCKENKNGKSYSALFES